MKPIVGKVIPNNVPERVHDSAQAPYKYVGLLEMKFPNQESYFGTATLIVDPTNDKGSSYVLTCAHNLFDAEDGGKAIKVTFTPAYNDPFKPYETIDATDWFYPEGYPDVAISKSVQEGTIGAKLLLESNELDYGLVKLSVPVPFDNIPTMVIENDATLLDLPVQINGYGYYDEAMSHATGIINGPITATSLEYAITTMKGASGSAIVKTDGVSIVGIHTRAVDGEDRNAGVRITADVVAKVTEWMGVEVAKNRNYSTYQAAQHTEELSE